MKTALFKSPVAALLLTSFFLWSCQPPSSDKSARKLTPLGDATAENQNTSAQKVCSTALLKLYKDLQQTEKQVKALATNEEIRKDNEGHQKEFVRISRAQLDLCQSVSDQFTIDQVDACFASTDVKTEETTLRKEKIEASCGEVENYLKKMKRPAPADPAAKKDSENRSEEGAQNEIVPVKEIEFTRESLELIQTKNPAEIKFISQGRIQIGLEALRAELADKKVACLFTSSTPEAVEETQFKFVAQTQESKSQPANLDFNGLSSSVFFQSKETMIAMLCMNIDLTAETNKVAALEKVFGDHIKAKSKKEDNSATANRTEERLNKDVPPTPEKKAVSESNSQQTSSDSADPTQKSVATAQIAIDEAVNKARATLNSVVKETLAEAEASAGRISAKSIADAKAVSIEVTNHAIAEAQKAALAVSAKSIADAKTASLEVTTHAITQAEKSAITVTNHAVAQGQKAAETVASKAIREATVSANQVVDQSIKKVKSAAKDSVQESISEAVSAPVKKVTEPIKKGYSNVKSYFSERTAELGVFWNRLTTSDPHGLKKKK